MGNIFGTKRKRPKNEEAIDNEEERPQVDSSSKMAKVDSVSAALKSVEIEESGKSYLDFPFLRNSQTIDFISNNKVMFIMRGLSGSGKSTVVRELVKTYGGTGNGVVVCSADDFFVDESSGNYYFNAELLKSAHSECQSKAKNAESNVIIIDNTHVKRWEMNFYVNLANSKGYRVVVLEPKTPWKRNAKELARRNSHNVTEDVLSKKLGQFDRVSPLYYAWFLSDDASRQLLAYSGGLLTSCLDFIEELEEGFFGRGNLGDILHCTAKFCGHSAAFDRDLEDKIGEVFKLKIVGFTITGRTFGAKVLLSDEQLEVYRQDDFEKEDLIAGKNGQKRNKNKKPSSKQRRLTALRENEAFKALEFVEMLDCDKEGLKRVKGSRAHITLGTAKDVPPVKTGLDTIKITQMDNELPQEEAENYEIEGGILRKVDDGHWIVHLTKAVEVQTIFAGFYTYSRKG